MCSDMAASHLTLKDIAREAGVSVATLDRVLHGRAGVREDTARRVREAIDRHGFRPFAAAAQSWRGAAAEQIRLRDAGRLQRLHAGDPRPCRRNVRLARRPPGERRRRSTANVFNPAALANTLESLAGRYDGDRRRGARPSERARGDRRSRRRRNLCRDARLRRARLAPPSLHRHRQCRRRADGRLADGTLPRRRAGKIGVIAGSQSLRDHAERIFGFNQVMSLEYPHFGVLSPVEGSDQDDVSEALTARLIDRSS